MLLVFGDQNLGQQARSDHPLLNRLRWQRCDGKLLGFHVTRSDEDSLDDLGATQSG